MKQLIFNSEKAKVCFRNRKHQNLHGFTPKVYFCSCYGISSLGDSWEQLTSILWHSIGLLLPGNHFLSRCAPMTTAKGEEGRLQLVGRLHCPKENTWQYLFFKDVGTCNSLLCQEEGRYEIFLCSIKYHAHNKVLEYIFIL